MADNNHLFCLEGYCGHWDCYRGSCAALNPVEVMAVKMIVSIPRERVAEVQVGSSKSALRYFSVPMVMMADYD